jgi:hypothetical protein
MIAVPTFQAYALSRPQGWAAGLYDGTFGDDGLRLFRDGNEVLHLPVGSRVRVKGSALTVPVAGGELTFEVRPPAPADPRGVAIGFAAFLAGTKADKKRVKREAVGIPWWLVLLTVAPTALAGGVWVWIGWRWYTVAAVAATVLDVFIVSRRRWTLASRAAMTATVLVAVVGLMLVGEYLRYLPL